MKRNEISDEIKIERLNYGIKNNLRLASICLIIWTLIIIWLLIWAVVIMIVEVRFNTLPIIEVIGVVFGVFNIISTNVTIIVMVYILRKKENINNIVKRIFNIILLVVAPFFILGSVLEIVYSVIYIASGKLASIIGKGESLIVGMIWEVVWLFNLIGYICVLISCSNAVKKYKIENADDINKYNERQKQLKKQQEEKNQYEKDLNSVTALLSKVGNKFFVKYYFELRDWTEPDILDIIEEDYTEETKTQRIREAKKIFDQRLNKLALQRISDVKNISVGEETRQKAKDLLDKTR